MQKSKLKVTLIIAVAGIVLTPPIFAWTNPEANPATGGGSIVAEQGSPANVIYIKANGNIGINSANPEDNRKLEVVGGGSNRHTASFIGASGVGVSIGYNGDEQGGSIQSFDKDIETIPDRYLPLLINPGGGNVGIGNFSPGSKLSVTGLVESTSGGFKFPDGTVQTETGGGNYSFPGHVGFGNFTVRYVTADSIGIYDSVWALVVEFDEGT